MRPARSRKIKSATKFAPTSGSHARLRIERISIVLGVTTYGNWVLLEQVPRIEDPGVPGHSVTEGMTFAAFEGFYRKAEAHAKKARAALATDDSEEATKLWRAIFGDRFPQVKSTSATGLLDKASAPRTAVFPDRPVKPNRPARFA